MWPFSPSKLIAGHSAHVCRVLSTKRFSFMLNKTFSLQFFQCVSLQGELKTHLRCMWHRLIDKWVSVLNTSSVLKNNAACHGRNPVKVSSGHTDYQGQSGWSTLQKETFRQIWSKNLCQHSERNTAEIVLEQLLAIVSLGRLLAISPKFK